MKNRRSSLHIFGWTVFAVGVVGVCLGFLMRTTIDSYSPIGAAGVVNIGLAVRQIAVITSSGLAMVAGAVFVAAGHIADLGLRAGAAQVSDEVQPNLDGFLALVAIAITVAMLAGLAGVVFLR